MAKKQTGLCIFCGEDPCACSGTKKRPKARTAGKKTKSVSTGDAGRSPSATTAASASDDVFEQTPIPDGKKRFKFSAAAAPARDLSYEAALLNLRDIVSERDRRWIDSQITHPTSDEADKQLHEWKERRNVAR